MPYPQIKKGVRITPFLNLVLTEMSSYIPRCTMVTSAFRSKEDQVKIIVKYALKEKFDGFSKTNISYNDKDQWAPALQFLRKLKNPYKIATPGRSKHESGIALDLIHLPNKDKKSLIDIKDSFHKAQADGKIVILNDIIEWNKYQKCYHVEVEMVRLEFSPTTIFAAG